MKWKNSEEFNCNKSFAEKKYLTQFFCKNWKILTHFKTKIFNESKLDFC